MLLSGAGAAITVMPRRCYSCSAVEGDAASLRGAEAHHLLHVLRAAPGDRVIVFDGSGYEFEARVTSCGRGNVVLAIEQKRLVDRELACDVTIGIALPKGDRSRWVVEKLVELGVSRIVPLTTHHSERPIRGGAASEKLRRYVIEACKQCGRNRLAVIDPPMQWSDWLQLPIQALGVAGADGAVRWAAHPGGESFDAARTMDRSKNVYIAIGPEGGLTEREAEEAEQANWRLIDLGPRMLRIETAAVAVMSAIALGMN